MALLLKKPLARERVCALLTWAVYEQLNFSQQAGPTLVPQHLGAFPLRDSQVYNPRIRVESLLVSPVSKAFVSDSSLCLQSGHRSAPLLGSGKR